MQIEGISYSINWRKFYRGHSFFVPCIDHKAAKNAIKAAAERLNIDLVMKVVIEEGVKGLRVWRC